MIRSVIRPRAALLPLALAAAGGAALAQTQVAALDTVFVTATRGPTRADDLTAETQVIERAAIEAGTARTLPELLARIAGLQTSNTGGRGKTSNMFIRGAENRHTILLVDGVRVGSASAGTPTWESIPLELVERVEIVKGPASALYGSDGIGGVVQVFLRKGREGQHPYATVTAGSRRHWSAGTGVQGGQGPWRYALGVQRLRERGFDATQPWVAFGSHDPDIDPFRQDSAQASLGYQFNRDWSADAGLLYSDGRSWYDDGPGINARTAMRGVTLHAGVRGRVAAHWQTELRFSQGIDTANLIESAWPGAFKTRETQWTWQNHVDTPVGTVLAGLERREQKINATTEYTVSGRSIDALFAGLNGSQGGHSWQLNLRHDRNSQFGNADTWYAGYGWRIDPNWRVHASRGTSFVAPSFNQLYYPDFGNPELQPERGRSIDLGITYSRGGHELKLVRFDNRIRGFMTNTTLPENVSRVRITGWSLGYEGRFDKLSLFANAEALEPRNETDDLQLPRRARHQVNLGADWRHGAWRYGAALLHVGKRWDDVANSQQLPAYTTVDLHADWQFAPAWSLQAKVNNLTDEQYETAYGYRQPGRGLYLTLRWQPK